MRQLRFVMFFLTTVCVFAAHGSEWKVECELRDSLTGEGEPFATVRVDFYPPTKQAAVMVLSDADGRVEAQLPKAGDYQLTVTATGKRPFSRQFTVSEAQPVARLGVVRLSGSVELQEVEVLAQKPLVTAEIDRLSYSVADDSESATKTTLDMLRRVPMVSVDGQDNIQVKGSSNFKVLVNGKPNPMMSGNPKEVLRNLPASAVKSIEVITDPGAKYDAEGVGGILNIVLQDVKVQGYNLSLSAYGSNNNIGGSAYGTYQLGKFTTTAHYSYGRFRQNSMRVETERVDLDEAGLELSRLLSQTEGDVNGDYHYASLQSSYEPDSLNLLTLAGTLMANDYTSLNAGTTARTGQLAPFGYSMTQNSRTASLNGSLAFDYQHSFRRKGEFLTTSYRFTASPTDNDADQTYSDIRDVPFDLPTRRQEDDRRHTEHTVQVDYVNPFSEKHLFDTGAKYIARRDANDSHVFIDGTFDLPSSSFYEQRQDIFALYADYTLRLGKLGAKAGVRYEHTLTSVDYEYDPASNFSSNFDDVVPSVTFSYNMGVTQMMRLSYFMRINRPGITFLSPFRSSTDPSYVSYGNPNLDTERWHNVSFNISSFGARLSGNASLNYSFTDNGISDYAFLQDGVQHTTYGNVLRSSRVDLSLWGQWMPLARTKLMLSLMPAYSDLRSRRVDASNSGFSLSGYGSVEQGLGKRMRLMGYGGGGSGDVTLQGKSMSYYFYGISFSCSFLKDDRLNLSLFANNVYPTRLSYETSIETDRFRYRTLTNVRAWNAGVSLSFRLGNLNTSVKRTQRTINNDDLKQAEQSSVPQQQGGQGVQR